MAFFTSSEVTRKKFIGNAICHFEITKNEAECKDFKRLNNFIKKVEPYAPDARQKVLFSFAGYDEDDRQLIDVPEVILYAKELITHHPYFWYYATPFNSEFFYLAILLDVKNSIIADDPGNREFRIGQSSENVKNLLNFMGISLDKYGTQIGDADGALDSFKVWAGSVMGHIS